MRKKIAVNLQSETSATIWLVYDFKIYTSDKLPKGK